MRAVSRFICLLYASSVGLLACTGTEVGNGARPKHPDEVEAPTSERGENQPDDSAGGTSTSGKILGLSDAVSFLLAPCASPLVDAGPSTFNAMPHYTMAVVDQSSDWRVDASQQAVAYSGVVRSAVTAEIPYALIIVDAKTLPVATNYTCSAISEQTTQTTGGTSTQRSLTVTTERGAALIQWWWLQPSSGSGRVTQIQVQVAESVVTFYREP